MRTQKMLLVASLVLFGGLASASAQQGTLDERADAAQQRQEGWEYKRSEGELTPGQIIRQKAQIRAAQRMQRMAALEWYGYSASRPRTSATPFTNQYGGMWSSDRWYARPDSWSVPQTTVVARPRVVVGYPY